MIKPKVMFEVYNVNLDTKIKEVQTRLEAVETLKKRLEKDIKAYYTKIGVDISTKDFKNPLEPFLEVNKNYKYLNTKIRDYNLCLKNRKTNKELLKVLVNQKISYSVFRQVLFSFNTKLWQRILYKRYTFKDHLLGTIKVVADKNKTPVPNWGESFKAREELIKEGKIPYKKEDEVKALAEGKTYEGVRWLKTLSDLRLFFSWQRNNNTVYLNPNMINFCFYPIRGNREDSPSNAIWVYSKSLTEEQLLTYKIEEKC